MIPTTTYSMDSSPYKSLLAEVYQWRQKTTMMCKIRRLSLPGTAVMPVLSLNSLKTVHLYKGRILNPTKRLKTRKNCNALPTLCLCEQQLAFEMRYFDTVLLASLRCDPESSSWLSVHSASANWMFEKAQRIQQLTTTGEILCGGLSFGSIRLLK